MINFFIKNQYCYDYVANQISISIITYSHLPTAIIALLFGSYVLYKSRSLNTFILFFVCLFFSIWSFLDLGAWVSWFNFTGPSSVMFSWSSLEIFGILIFLYSFYFLYVSVKEKDIPFYYKIFGVLSLIPISYWEITGKILDKYDTYSCAAIESNSVSMYITIIESVIILAVTIFTIFELNKVKGDSEKRKKIVFSGPSVFIFLIVFSLSGSLADFLNNLGWKDAYNFGVYSLFGMPILLIFLGYMIVKYRSFNIKIFGTQALVAALLALIWSELFFVNSLVNEVLVSITLLIALFFGYFLIKSVKKEIEVKEKLALANIHLKELDIQKSEFVSFATHQIRSPLASMRGYASLILEGDTGPVNDSLRKVVETILTSTKTLASVVEDYLNISRIELGTMKYDMKDIDFGDLVTEVVNEQKPNIDAKGLTFKVDVDNLQKYPIKADLDKFKQVIMNIVDNSVKYTPTGSLTISLSKNTAKGTVTFKVSDTGVGIAPDVMPKLFRKFSRANNASEANIHGTGLGLYIAKEIVTAHGGKMWAESEGEGKGSQFYVEMGESM